MRYLKHIQLESHERSDREETEKTWKNDESQFLKIDENYRSKTNKSQAKQEQNQNAKKTIHIKHIIIICWKPLIKSQKKPEKGLYIIWRGTKVRITAVFSLEIIWARR